MDIQTIARRTRLPARVIRYVLDQRMLDLRVRLQKSRAGRPRDLTDLEGYSVALAARLVNSGVRRATVTMIMERLANIPWPAIAPRAGTPTDKQRATARPRFMIEAAYYWACEASTLSIGDGLNLRLRVGPVDSRWIEPHTLAPLHEDYRPRVCIIVDLRQLWREFCSEDEE